MYPSSMSDLKESSVHWYALRSKPRKEEAAYREVVNRGYEAYFPRLRVNPVNPRSKKFQPYFPGYLFLRADVQAVGISVFQWMPHTLGLVMFGGEPAAVPENLVHELRSRLAQVQAAGGQAFAGLQPGDVVRVESGPFAGYEAIFDARLDGTERVRVLLRLLNSRQMPLELPVGQVVRLKNKA